MDEKAAPHVSDAVEQGRAHLCAPLRATWVGQAAFDASTRTSTRSTHDCVLRGAVATRIAHPMPRLSRKVATIPEHDGPSSNRHGPSCDHHGRGHRAADGSGPRSDRLEGNEDEVSHLERHNCRRSMADGPAQAVWQCARASAAPGPSSRRRNGNGGIELRLGGERPQGQVGAERRSAG